MRRSSALLPALLLTGLLAGCDAAQIDACASGDQVLCGITRPEDLEVIPGSPWMLVSELGGGEKPGRILLVNFATKERRVLAEQTPEVSPAPDFPQCGPPPATLRPRGFHLSLTAAGQLRLFVIVGTRVERYAIQDGFVNPKLVWEGCVEIPGTIMANDVAAFPEGGAQAGFVVSHMYDPPRSFWHNVKFVLGINTGAVMKWSAANGWTKIPNTDVSFANGVQINPSTSRVYVSSMFTQRIIAVDPDGNNRVESERSLIQADNLSWGPDGRLIGAGHTGFPIYGISACRDIGDAPCSFPFAVVAFDPVSLAAQTLFRTETGSIPGASVAVERDGALYLGTAFGDRITRVSLQN